MDRASDQAKDAREQSGDSAMTNEGRPLVVYVDVDDTFVRSVGTKRIPMTRVVEHVRQLHASGALLYCWSSGGPDYARRSTEEFGIQDCFQAFLPKPNVMIDDQSVAEWRLCLEVHPLSIKNQIANQYWEEIRAR